MMTLRDKLAAVQHEIWAHWMRYQFSVCIPQEDGSLLIPAKKVERWRRQMETVYADLTEQEQRSDLEQADKVLAALPGELLDKLVPPDSDGEYWFDGTVTRPILRHKGVGARVLKYPGDALSGRFMVADGKLRLPFWDDFIEVAFDQVTGHWTGPIVPPWDARAAQKDTDDTAI